MAVCISVVYMVRYVTDLTVRFLLALLSRIKLTLHHLPPRQTGPASAYAEFDPVKLLGNTAPHGSASESCMRLTNSQPQGGSCGGCTTVGMHLDHTRTLY